MAASCCRIKAPSVNSRGTAATSYLIGMLQEPGFISNTRSNLGCDSSKLSKSKMALGNGKARDNDEVVKKEDRNVERDGKK